MPKRKASPTSPHLDQVKKTTNDMYQHHSIRAQERSYYDEFLVNIAAAREAKAQLGKNARKTPEEYKPHSIFEHAQFYRHFLTCLARAGSMMNLRWFQDEPTPLGFFNRLCDLNVRLRTWVGDAFPLERREDSWESNEEFHKSLLCRVVLRCLDPLETELSEIAVVLNMILRDLPDNDRDQVSLLGEDSKLAVTSDSMTEPESESKLAVNSDPMTELESESFVATLHMSYALEEKFAGGTTVLDAISLALRNLSGVLPALQEYNAASDSSDRAKIRGHIWTIRQQTIAKQTRAEEDGLEQKPTYPFAAASPLPAEPERTRPARSDMLNQTTSMMSILDHLSRTLAEKTAVEDLELDPNLGHPKFEPSGSKTGAFERLGFEPPEPRSQGHKLPESLSAEEEHDDKKDKVKEDAVKERDRKRQKRLGGGRWA